MLSKLKTHAALVLLTTAFGCMPGETAPSDPAPSLESVARLDATVARDLAHAADRPVTLRASGGFELAGSAPRGASAFASLGTPVDAELPRTGSEPLRVRTRSGAEIVARRRNLGSAPAALDRGVVTYDDGHGVASMVFANGTSLEELFVVKAETELGYDLALPSGWSLREADRHTIEIVDGHGAVTLRVASLHAWDPSGRAVELATSVDANGIRIRVEGDPEYPVVVDPSWSHASVPLKLRTHHTATLLPDGRVLSTGGLSGGGADASTELYDPRTGISTFGPAMSTGRYDHTATLLRDGRVLVLGGHGPTGAVDTTELFDPVTGTLAAGPTMSATRERHTATRLADGRVLVLGLGTTAELFDPTTDTFASAGAHADFATVASALLPDGRVLAVGLAGGTATAQVFDPARARSPTPARRARSSPPARR